MESLCLTFSLVQEYLMSGFDDLDGYQLCAPEIFIAAVSPVKPCEITVYEWQFLF